MKIAALLTLAAATALAAPPPTPAAIPPHPDKLVYEPFVYVPPASRDYRAVLKSGPVVYAEVPGAQHAFDIFPSIRTAHVIRAIERYVDFMYTRYRHGQRADRGEVVAS